MAGTPSRTLVLTLTAVTDKFAKGLGGAEKQLGGFGQKLGDFSKKAALAFAAVGAAAGALAIKIGKEAIGAASDLSEEIQKAEVIFGDSAGAIDEWAQTAANAFGQSRRQATAAASNFAIFGKSAGLTGDELVDFSTGFTELASDLASFNNTDPEDAIQALGAALRGESEPIRRYGILLDDATLRQQALELGIVQTTKEALTPQQRVLAAQAAILAQVGDATGDFARTSDGLANSQRILKANLEDTKTIIGEALLPVAEEFSGWLVSVLPDVIEFAKEMGEKLGPAVERVGDWIKNNLLPAARDVWPHIRDFALWVKDLVEQVIAFLREDVAPRFRTLISELEEPATNAWTAIKEMAAAIREAKEAFQAANPEGSVFWDILWRIERLKWDVILGKIERLAEGVAAIARDLERLANAWKRLRDLGAVGGAFGGSGGDFDIPDGFVPGSIAPSTRSSASAAPNYQITINGPIDAESTAREIRRILSDSSRRTGFAPVLV
jgi:hypothetical protein